MEAIDWGKEIWISVNMESKLNQIFSSGKLWNVIIWCCRLQFPPSQIWTTIKVFESANQTQSAVNFSWRSHLREEEKQDIRSSFYLPIHNELSECCFHHNLRVSVFSQHLSRGPHAPDKLHHGISVSGILLRWRWFSKAHRLIKLFLIWDYLQNSVNFDA